MESDAASLPLSAKLWAWFETNKKQALYGAIGLVVVGVIAGFIYWKQNESEVEADEALSAVSAPHMGTPGARAGAAEAFLKVAAKYPGSGAALRAELFAATSYFLDGKYPEAKTQFDKFARDHRDSLLLGQALLGSAASLDAQGKVDEAITGYKNIVDRHPGDVTIQEAKFALARLYESKNQWDDARALYEEIIRNDPFRSSIGDESALRLEDLRIKHPAPPPPTATQPKPTLNLTPSTPAPASVPTGPIQTNAKPAAKATTNTTIVLPPSNAAPFKLQTH